MAVLKGLILMSEQAQTLHGSGVEIPGVNKCWSRNGLVKELMASASKVCTVVCNKEPVSPKPAENAKL